jgi:hypothetical protein
MAGWDTNEGTSVSATDRFRAAMAGRRRRNAKVLATAPEQAPAASTGLREDRLSLVSDYIGDYPDAESERLLCNQAFQQPPAPLERAS